MLPGTYIHLPFCKIHCSYCDFPLTTRMELSRPYYEALRKELQMCPPRPSDTLYFGGGTPSTTPLSVIEELIHSVTLITDAEITLETNPDDVTNTSLEGWLKAGITRLSLGVQSLEPAVLNAMLRSHSAQNAMSAIKTARASGFGNLSVDLILGSPEQTTEGFIRGMMQLINFRPQHISLYLLEVHEGTLLERQILENKVEPMKENEQVECYLQAAELMKNSGYRHYEISNFALAGFESRHNLKYWTNAPYYAYGAGACSYYDKKRIQNFRGIPEYIQALTSGKLPVESEIPEDSETEARNTIIFGLRKIEGIDVMDFQTLYGMHPLSLFEDNGSFFLQEGLLEVKQGRLRITQNGLLVSNEILSSAF